MEFATAMIFSAFDCVALITPFDCVVTLSIAVVTLPIAVVALSIVRNRPCHMLIFYVKCAVIRPWKCAIDQ